MTRGQADARSDVYAAGILLYELLSNPLSGFQVFPGPVHVSALRKLLGPKAIATIPGRGYRFTALLDGEGDAAQDRHGPVARVEVLHLEQAHAGAPR